MDGRLRGVGDGDRGVPLLFEVVESMGDVRCSAALGYADAKCGWELDLDSELGTDGRCRDHGGDSQAYLKEITGIERGIVGGAPCCEHDELGALEALEFVALVLELAGFLGK